MPGKDVQLPTRTGLSAGALLINPKTRLHASPLACLLLHYHLTAEPDSRCSVPRLIARCVAGFVVAAFKMAEKPNSDTALPLSSPSKTTVIGTPAVNKYGRVIISLENCLLPEERLSTTPSSLDGLDPETEMDLRILGCELIQTAGILLRLPQVATCYFIQ